jgi:hypothetical protein
LSVHLEFINVLIRRDALERVYPGGFQQYVRDNAEFIGITCWFDEDIVREGAMSPQDAKGIVEYWEGLGLKAATYKRGRPVEWIELCVAGFGGTAVPCSWLRFSIENGASFTPSPIT